MLDNLKKYWFVILVGAIAVVGVGFYTVDQMNSIFRGKKIDGVSVIASANDENLLVDEYYDLLYKQKASSTLYTLFERSVLSSIETSDDIRKEAKDNAASTLASFSQQGASGLEQLDSILVSLGYTDRNDLQLYFEDLGKRYDLIRTYLTETDTSDIAQKYIDTNKSRIVSHILVKMDDPANPTDANKEKIASIEKALADGKDFASVAAEFSDDGSAVNGGLIGYIDKSNTQYVKEFVEGSVAIEGEGKTSEWIKTQYGWHLIHVDSTALDKLIEETGFLDAVVNSNPTILYQTIWDKAEAIGLEVGNEDVKKELIELMGIEVSE